MLSFATNHRIDGDGGVATGPERAGDLQPSCLYRLRGGGNRTNVHPRPNAGDCFPLMGMGTGNSMAMGR
jgi:hypothetical protein